MIAMHKDFLWPGLSVLGAFVALALAVMRPTLGGNRRFALWAAPPILVYAALNMATWSARLDDKGVEVHAPFDLLQRGGRIAWSDVAEVQLMERGARYRAWNLEIYDHARRRLSLPIQSVRRDEAPSLVEFVLARSNVDQMQADAVRRQLPYIVRAPNPLAPLVVQGL